MRYRLACDWLILPRNPTMLTLGFDSMNESYESICAISKSNAIKNRISQIRRIASCGLDLYEKEIKTKEGQLCLSALTRDVS